MFLFDDLAEKLSHWQTVFDAAYDFRRLNIIQLEHGESFRIIDL